MGSRNILTLLIIVFVMVLIYNGLYFTGMIGGFGDTSTVQELPEDPRFDIPGLRPDQAQRPVPSGQAASAGGASTNPSRSTIRPAAISIGSNWGRNPFLTPQEIWALENYRPVYEVAPRIPPEGLHLSAVVLDSSGRRVAIINGDVFGVGDLISGMEVVDVWSDGVVVQLDGQRHVIRMGDPEIRLNVSGGANGRQP